MPTLVHDGFVVTESVVINEYLDDAFREVPLMPDSAQGRARVRHWTKQIDDLDFHADFLNSDKSERWTLIGHPGDAHTGFEMRLARAKAEDQGYPALDVAHFATGKGVTLGMSPAELAQLLGPGKAVKQGASLRVEYEIDPDRYPWNQRFGKRCGFPGYAAEYTFVDGRLAAFRFGSPYP